MTETLRLPKPESSSNNHRAASNTTSFRPLDVLILTSEAPPIISGISTCVGKLVNGLVVRGHRVKVISSDDIPGFTLHELWLSSFLARWPGVVRQLGQFDVVNIHGPVPTMSDVFLRLSPGLPDHDRPAIVYTYHSPIDIRGASRISARYNRYHDLLAMHADRIVTSSRHYADHYYSRYGPVVQVIPWGAEVRSSPPSRPKSQSGTLNVLFVGQMRPYKGVETLLAAVAGQSRLKLTLVGSGPKLGSYKRIAKRLGATNTEFIGRLTDKELQEQYDANDVIVLPSVTRAEAFGLVLLEGMAAGCVPVASDLPGVREVAGPTGVLVVPGDIAELRTALVGLADDNDRLESLQADSWLAAQALSWQRCIDAYQSVFFDAVRSRYAQLHGIAMLPEIDRPDRGDKEAISAQDGATGGDGRHVGMRVDRW